MAIACPNWEYVDSSSSSVALAVGDRQAVAGLACTNAIGGFIKTLGKVRSHVIRSSPKASRTNAARSRTAFHRDGGAGERFANSSRVSGLAIDSSVLPKTPGHARSRTRSTTSAGLD